MRKHSFSNKIKSMFGSYIDPDKDEEIKGSYIEMEENYRKIIEILKDEDMNDRQKVVEMIEDFHKHHQSVYERYDHITGELKAKFHSKKEKDSSSSSSSDSGSDDNFTKKGSKNGKLKVRHILKEQLQAATAEFDVLTEKLKVATDEKKALLSDYQALLNKEQETEKIIGELKLEAGRLHEENSKLSEDNKDLNLKFENFKVGLEAEFSKQVEELKTVIVRLEGENESFNSELSKTKEKLESTEAELTNVSQTLEATESVNKALSIKGSEFADEIKTKDEKIEELSTECSQLRENLADKEKELLSHMEMHTSHKSETENKMRGFEENFESLSSQKREIEIHKDEEIKKLAENVSNFQKELESLNDQKSKLEDDVNEKQEEILSLRTHKLESESQLEKSSQEISGCLIQINSLIQEVAGKTADEQKLIQEKEVYVAKVKDLEEEVKLLNGLKTESETEVGRKNEEIADHVLQIENYKVEVAKITADQVKLVEEKEGSESKIKDLELKLESVSGSKNESETELEKRNAEISELLIVIQGLKEELETKSKEQEKMVEEKEVVELKVKDLELQLESINNLKNESEMHIEKKGLEISELLILSQSLKGELESKSLDHVKTVQEKDAYESKVKDLELNLESMNSLKIELEMQLEKKGTEISGLLSLSQSLKEELESKSKEQAKTLEEKEISESKVKDLELKLESLNAQKNETELLLEKKVLELSELTILIESLKEEVENKSKDQAKTVEEKESYATKVNDLEKELTSAIGLKDDLQKQFESEKQDYLQLQNQLKDKIQELEKTVAEKEQTIEKLAEAIEDLKGDLEIKADEVTSMTETVRNLEVKIRLTNQKLRVTEQTLSEKEDDHLGKQEKLHQENKSLVSKISTLSETISFYKETEESVKKQITQKVNEISGGIDSLAVKFEEDHGHISTRVLEIMNEIQVSKISVKNISSEKDGLKEKVSKTMIQLKALETENERLTDSVDQLERKTVGKDDKINELETLIRVKDDGLQDLGEEKREVIRQLCMLADYQRDRYDRLREILSKKTAAGRR